MIHLEKKLPNSY